LLTRSSDPENRRYSMLDMVREFGWANLTLAERTDVQDRHAAYFRQLVFDSETLHVSSGSQQLPKLRLEFDNIRVAAEWTLLQKDVDAASRLALALLTMWIYAGYQQGGRTYVNQIREQLEYDEMQGARLNAAEGILACFQDDAESGRARILEALTVFEKAGLGQHIAAARWALGYAAYLNGDFEESLVHAHEMAPAIGKYWSRWQTYQRNLVGFASIELGRLDEAMEVLLEVERSWRELGDLLFVDFCRLSLARITWKRGNFEEAWHEYYDVALAFGRWNDRRGLAYATEGLGRIAADLSLFDQAARLLGASQRLRESLGLKRDFADDRAYEEAAAKSRSALGFTYETEWQAGFGVAPDRTAGWLGTLQRP
jgi:hypothetical protein